MNPDLSLTPALAATPHRFAWHPATRTAILADLHLGIESSLAAQGLYLPAAHLPAIERQWSALLARTPAQVILAGDLFDMPAPPAPALEFARILIRQLPESCRLILLPGNHDPDDEHMRQLFPVALIAPAFPLAPGILISHGHEIPADLSSASPPSTWITGHQHPAVTLSTRTHRAKMPCFATCTLQSPSPHSSRETQSHLILLPAFSPAPLGSNLLTPAHWLLPVPRPANPHIRIAGLIESEKSPSQILDFGQLSQLEVIA